MIIAVLMIDQKSLKIIKSAYKLDQFSYFTRKSVKEIVNLTSVQISKSLHESEFQEFSHQFDNQKTYTFFCKLYDKKSSKNVNIMVVDSEYPKHVALLALNDFNDPQVDLKKFIEEFEDVDKKDILASVNKELDETKAVLSKALEDVMGRGEKLDTLVENAENLSFQTRALFQMSKKQNSCYGCR